MIGYSCLHRRGDSQCLVNPGEVVVHEMQRHGMGLVFDLLAKGVGQPGHPSHAHPHGEVLPFHEAR